MASPTLCTWVWVNFRSWWWTGRPGVPPGSWGCRVRHDRVTEVSWTELWLTEKMKRLWKLIATLSSLRNWDFGLFKQGDRFPPKIYIYKNRISYICWVHHRCGGKNRLNKLKFPLGAQVQKSLINLQCIELEEILWNRSFHHTSGEVCLWRKEDATTGHLQNIKNQMKSQKTWFSPHGLEIVQMNLGEKLLRIPWGKPDWFIYSFPGDSDGKQSTCQWRRHRRLCVRSLSWEDLLVKEMQGTLVFLPGKSHGWRSMVGYSPWGCKQSDMTERLTLS